ncbi:MAG: hypothetical protein AAFX94_15715 [Myxococcota bacterium]
MIPQAGYLEDRVAEGRMMPLTNSPPAMLTYDGTVLKQWLQAMTLVDKYGEVE